MEAVGERRQRVLRVSTVEPQRTAAEGGKPLVPVCAKFVACGRTRKPGGNDKPSAHSELAHLDTQASAGRNKSAHAGTSGKLNRYDETTTQNKVDTHKTREEHTHTLLIFLRSVSRRLPPWLGVGVQLDDGVCCCCGSIHARRGRDASNNRTRHATLKTPTTTTHERSEAEEKKRTVALRCIGGVLIGLGQAKSWSK